MNIVTGSGGSRKVFVFPHASIVNKSPVEEQVAARNLLCNILGISADMESVA